MENSVICAECGSVMVLRQTEKFKYGNGAPRKFYGCSRWPKCNGIHGAHPDGKPFGKPANKETKNARIKAHYYFDELWKSRGMSRGAAYRWLADRLQIPVESCHISSFDKKQCEAVIAIFEQGGQQQEVANG